MVTVVYSSSQNVKFKSLHTEKLNRGEKRFDEREKTDRRVEWIYKGRKRYHWEGIKWVTVVLNDRTKHD